MAGQMIDYDALAKQHGAIAPAPGGPLAGGAIDYDALARQHGATSSAPPEPPSLSGFAGNVLGSGARMVENTVDALIHPIDTITSLASIPVGVYQKAGGPVPAGFDDHHLKMVDAMIDHLKQRYGSLDAAKKTLYEDPVGVMADLSTALGGGGGVLSKAGKLSEVGALGRAGEVVSTLSRVTNPVSIVTRPAAAAGRWGASKAGLNAEDLYRTALRPRIDTPVEDVRQMVQTGLTNTLPVSESGAEALQGLLTDLQSKIEAKTKAAGAAGITIDPKKVAQRVDEIEARMGGTYSQVNPVKDRQTIQRSREEFLAENTLPGQTAVPPQPTGMLDPYGRPIMTPGQPATLSQSIPIPADDAQRMKVGTYQKIRQDYGAMSTAQVESQKALARGLKEELSAALPELTGLNESQGKLLDLQPVLESAVNKAANRSGWFKHMVTAGAATAIGGKPLGAVYSIMSAVLDDPAVRSRLAIAINKAQQNNPAKWGAPNVATSLSRVNEYAASIKRALDAQQQPVNP
jgi:hypothetical protein